MLREADLVEFSLPVHVYKRLGRDGKPDLYIIGVWNGTTAEAICLWQPLGAALEALGRTLTAAGTTQGTSSLVAK
jgi:hypothetical protein